jgi:hypothetical protein
MHFSWVFILFCGLSRCYFSAGGGGVARQSADSSLKIIAESSREMRRKSPPSRVKNCIDVCMNVHGCGQVGKQNMIERMITLGNKLFLIFW